MKINEKIVKMKILVINFLFILNLTKNLLKFYLKTKTFKRVYITNVGLHCIFFFSPLKVLASPRPLRSPHAGGLRRPLTPGRGLYYIPISFTSSWCAVHSDTVQSAQPHVGKLYLTSKLYKYAFLSSKTKL